MERLLARLAEIRTLSLLITMRGSERPLETAWTQPHVAPLQPLNLKAARSTFVAISGTSPSDPYLDELLKALDNLPLAITLMANLAQSETPKVLLKRWYSEYTTMLSRGSDHRLCLEISIRISLDGPRMRQTPDADKLLRLLALLPQGSKELPEAAPNISNIHKAATVLKQVGLAHVDGVGSLRVLAPVRKFIIQNFPPNPLSWNSVQVYFQSLATLSADIERGSDGRAIIARLSSQTSNIQAVLERSLDMPGADIPELVRSAIALTDLFKYTGLGSPTTLEKSAQKAESIGCKALLADCLRCQAEIHYSRSSPVAAAKKFEIALALYRVLEEDRLSEQGLCTMMLGMIDSQGGKHQEAIAKIGQAIEFHRRANNSIGEVSMALTR